MPRVVLAEESNNGFWFEIEPTSYDGVPMKSQCVIDGQSSCTNLCQKLSWNESSEDQRTSQIGTVHLRL